MVHGNDCSVYYGINITKELFDSLSLQIPMVHAKLFEEVRQKNVVSYIIYVEVKLDYEKLRELNKFIENGRDIKSIYIDKTKLINLMEKLENDILSDDFQIIINQCKKEKETIPSSNKFIEIYTKVMGNYYEYMGLQNVKFEEIEPFCKPFAKDDLKSQLEEKLSPIKQYLPSESVGEWYVNSTSY